MEPLFSKRTLGPGLRRLLGLSMPFLRRWVRTGYFTSDLEGVPLERVLLIACHWIGDTFWATQLLGPLRERLGPDAEVWVATRRRSRDLWSGLIPSERVVVLNHVISDRRRETFTWGGLRREAKALRAHDLDLVLDLTSNRYSALTSFLARPRRAFGCAGNELDRLYSGLAATYPPGAHLVLRPFHVAAPLLGPPPAKPPPVQPLPVASLNGLVREVGLDPDRPFVVLAPGAGWKSKQWPADRFAVLAPQLEDQRLQVLAVGGANEQALLETVVAHTERGRVLAGAGLVRLNALLERARLVLCNDSAVGHLAAAHGTPVVVLFASTNPAQNVPLGPRVRVLRSGCPDRPEGDQLHCHDDPEHPCQASCWDGLDTRRVLVACKQELLG